MAREEFEIEIRPNGEVSIKTIGIKGTDCIDAANQIVRMIQGKEIESVRTSEFYEMDTNQVDNVNQTWNRWE